MSNKVRKCTNCNYEVGDNDNFCSNCGQKTDEASLKIKYFIKDFLSANFNIESKISQTLKLLIFHPAKLTTEFIAGRKAKYISPIRLYLVISLVYFFIVSLDLTNNDSQTQQEIVSTDSINTAINTNDELINLTLDDEETMSNFEKLIAKKIKFLNSENGIYKFKQNFRESIPKGMFLLLPLIALILLLLFYKDTYYIQHFVFTLHLQSLIFIIASFSLLLEFFISLEYVIWPELILMYLLTFVWVKRFYNLSNKRTFWKLVLFYILLAILFLIHLSLLMVYNFYLL